MSTSNSLRTVARGEQAYRKHLKARREPAGDGDSTKGKGWTFSKLEYLSRTQLLEPEQDRKDGKMSEARWAGREQDKKQQEARRREILILISDHLKDEGFSEAAETLAASLPWDLAQYSVCDNVDLKIILEEFSSFHQVKYGKKPEVCRRSDKENSEVSSVKRKRTHKLTKRSSSLGNKQPPPPLAETCGVSDLQITGKSVVEEDIGAADFSLPASLMSPQRVGAGESRSKREGGGDRRGRGRI